MGAYPIVPENLSYPNLLSWFRELATPTLKRMWDSPLGEKWCDEIHRVMHERGEGSYVAV